MLVISVGMDEHVSVLALDGRELAQVHLVHVRVDPVTGGRKVRLGFQGVDGLVYVRPGGDAKASIASQVERLRKTGRLGTAAAPAAGGGA